MITGLFLAFLGYGAGQMHWDLAYVPADRAAFFGTKMNNFI